MPSFSYVAKSPKGELKSGIIVAKDKYELSQTLRQEGYILIKAEQEKEFSKKNFILSFPFMRQKVSLKEKLFFVKNLEIMIKAGVPLTRALKTLSEQTNNEKFKEILNKISEDIARGESFSSALSKHPDVFPELFYNMIKIGEESGTMEEILKNLTSQMEKENELRSKIKGAMMYPAVILTAMLGIGILMMVLVVPTLSQMFKDANVDLPLTTKLIFGMGDFFVNYWIWLILIASGVIIAFRFFLKSDTGKKNLDTISLKLPVISTLVRETNAAYTSRILGSLVASGVPIVNSLEIISRTLGNFYFKGAIAAVAKQVQKGSKFSESLMAYQNLYPIMMIRMIEIGEETGETSGILLKLADFYENEVSEATKNLSTIIEPVLMIVIGIFVALFVISIVQPMYGMMSTI